MQEPTAESQRNHRIGLFSTCFQILHAPTTMVANPLTTDPIANQRIHLMTIRAEAPQLDLLTAYNFLRIAVSPLHRHLGIRIRIHQHVERAVAV